MLNNILIIPAFKEKIKVKLALAIPTSAPRMLAKEVIVLHQLLRLKQLEFCLCNQKQQRIC